MKKLIVTLKSGVAKTSQHKAARAAGLIFLIILTAVLLNSVVFSKLIIEENALDTASNMLSNSGLLRIGISNELMLSIGSIGLGLALYITLKPVNKNLALLGLTLKLMEAILSAMIALLNFVALQILSDPSHLTKSVSKNVETLAGSFLNVHDDLYAIPMVFLGLNLVVFSYLFYKSNYIPSLLAGLGIFSYALIFLFAIAVILLPDLHLMILTTPSILFELLIGLWLLFKGIKTSGHGP